MDKVTVKCVAPLFTGNTFTNGRHYEAFKAQDVNIWTVTDDLGHIRYIRPDERSAHLPPSGWAEFGRGLLGRFETVTEGEDL